MRDLTMRTHKMACIWIKPSCKQQKQLDFDSDSESEGFLVLRSNRGVILDLPDGSW